MVTAIITFAADSTGKAEIEESTGDGEVVNVAGVVNVKWEDFSALEVARDAGFMFVEWDALVDDTPGSLTLTVRYPNLSIAQIEKRLQTANFIESCEFV